MVNVTQVADGTYLIEPEASKRQDKRGMAITCAMFLVVDQRSALIETGPSAVLREVLEGLRLAGCDPSTLTYVIPTHVHMDHAGGAGSLARMLPQVQVVALERGARHMMNPSRLIEGTKEIFGKDFEKEHGPILPVQESQMLTVQDGDGVSLGSRELRLIATPGHASHDTCIFDTKTVGLFSGGTTGSHETGTSFVQPGHPPVFDLDQCLKSLGKLRRLNPQPQIMFYTHQGYSRDVARLMALNEELTKGYGDIILAGLKAGEDPEEIAQKVARYQEAKSGGQYHLDPAHLPRIDGYVDYFKRKGLV